MEGLTNDFLTVGDFLHKLGADGIKINFEVLSDSYGDACAEFRFTREIDGKSYDFAFQANSSDDVAISAVSLYGDNVPTGWGMQDFFNLSLYRDIGETEQRFREKIEEENALKRKREEEEARKREEEKRERIRRSDEIRRVGMEFLEIAQSGNVFKQHKIVKKTEFCYIVPEIFPGTGDLKVILIHAEFDYTISKIRIEPSKWDRWDRLPRPHEQVLDSKSDYFQLIKVMRSIIAIYGAKKLI